MHEIACARVLALDNAGSNIAANMAMMAMTTSSSINVKAHKCRAGRLTSGARTEWEDFMTLQSKQTGAGCGRSFA